MSFFTSFFVPSRETATDFHNSTTGANSSRGLSHLQRGKCARKTYIPSGPVEYMNAVANGVQFNRKLNYQREGRIKRRWTIQYYGYEAVLDDDQMKTCNGSPNGGLNETMQSQTIAVGDHVVVCSNLALLGTEYGYLSGKKGRVIGIDSLNPSEKKLKILLENQSTITLPAAAVYINNPIATQKTLSVAKKSNTNNNLEALESLHASQMQQLVASQFAEIQILQRRHSDCLKQNSPDLPDIQKQLSSLRNRHLLQIQQLKQKQSSELLEMTRY